MIIVTQTMALLLCYISNSYGTRVNQYCESNVTRGQGKQTMVREKSGKSQGILWGAIAGYPAGACALAILRIWQEAHGIHRTRKYFIETHQDCFNVKTPSYKYRIPIIREDDFIIVFFL